jgi:sugar phosphate isomerase/epimerase
MHLVRGFGPRFVGVYLDPAHLSVGGEYLPMALDMVRGYLRMIGVKNARHVPSAGAGGPRWKVDWCPLSEGLVYWPEAVKLLKESGYDGPLSVHGEYSASEQTAEVLKLVAQDMAHLLPLLR